MYSAAVNAHIRELIEQVMEYRDQGQWQKLEQLFNKTPYIDEAVLNIERTGKKEVSAESEIEARYYTLKNGERHVFKMNGVYEYQFKKVAGRWKIDSLRLRVKDKSFSPVGA